MPSPSRIPRSKTAPTKTPNIRNKQNETNESNRSKTVIVSSTRKNIKQPAHSFHSKSIKSDANVKKADRRGITEIKRSESALLQTVQVLENKENLTKEELQENQRLVNQLSASESQLKEQIKQLEMQHLNLCVLLEQNGYDPVKGTKLNILHDAEADMKEQAKHTKIDVDNVVNHLTNLDNVCDQVLNQLQTLDLTQAN